MVKDKTDDPTLDYLIGPGQRRRRSSVTPAELLLEQLKQEEEDEKDEEKDDDDTPQGSRPRSRGSVALQPGAQWGWRTFKDMTRTSKKKPTKDPRSFSTYSPTLVYVLTLVVIGIAICLAGSLLGIWLVVSELHNLQRVQREREEKISNASDCARRGGDLNCSMETQEEINNWTTLIEMNKKKIIKYDADRVNQTKERDNLEAELKKLEATRPKPAKQSSAIEHTFLRNKHASKVYFTVVMDTRYNIKPDSIIVFDKVLIQPADYYSVTTGTFTAPVDGVYLFKVHLQTDDSVDMEGNLYGFKVSLKVNGLRKISLMSLRAWGSVSNSAVLRLDKDDTVALWGSMYGIHGDIDIVGVLARSKTGTDGAPLCSFTGVILYELEDDPEFSNVFK